MKTIKKSQYLFVMACGISLCVHPIAALGMDSLAPESRLKDKHWRKAVKQSLEQGSRDVDFMNGPGSDKREMANRWHAMRHYIGKILSAELGVKEESVEIILKTVKNSEVEGIFELLQAWGGAIPSHWVVPAGVKDAVWFLNTYRLCQNTEVLHPDVYQDAARFLCQEIHRNLVAYTAPSTPNALVDVFLTHTFYPERDVDSPMHCAHTLQQVCKMSPTTAELLFMQSLQYKKLPAFLLIYQLLPDRSVFKSIAREHLLALSPEMFKAFFGKHASAPSAVDALVYASFKACEKSGSKIITLKMLCDAVTRGAVSGAGMLPEELDSNAVAGSVARLNQMYQCNILLSDSAHGFMPARLKEVRTAKRLSQQELAKLSAVDDITILRYETGQTLPGTKYLKKLAAALDVTPFYFVGGGPGPMRFPRLDPQRLKNAREAKGLLQGELAIAIGEGQWVVARLETGKKIAVEKDKSLVEKIAVELGVPYNYLMGLEDIELQVRFVPDRFIRARQYLGWSLNKAVHELGFVYTTIKKWEDGKSVPTNAQLKTIAEKMNVSPAYLAGEGEQELKVAAFSPKRMKAMRVRLALTQEELSEKLIQLGYSPGNISQWENGIKEPFDKNIEGLAKALGVSKGYLLGVEGEDIEVPSLDPHRLRKMRVYAGYSTISLAETLHDASAHIQSLEAGKTKPLIPTVRRIASALNVTYGYLMGFEHIARPESLADMDLSRKVFATRLPKDKRMGVLVQASYDRFLKEHLKNPTADELVAMTKIVALKVHDPQFQLNLKRTNILRALVTLNREDKALVILADYAYGYWPKRIQEIRTQLRMHQEDLAQKIGASRGAIQTYEYDTIVPTVETLRNIARVLGVDFLYFMGSDAVKIKLPQFDGKRMKLAREAKGWTQEQLAASLGVPGWQVPKWETSAPPRDKAIVEGIAVALDVPYDYLMGLEEYILTPAAKPVFQGQRLRAARLHKGWTEEKAAGELGLAPGDIKGLEDGSRAPNSKQVDVMTEKFNVPQEYLFGQVDLTLEPVAMPQTPKFQPQALIAARQRKGLTKKQLAEAMGYKKEVLVYQWERGHHVPSEENLEELMDILSVTQEFLMGLEPMPSINPVLFGSRLSLAMAYRGVPKENLAVALNAPVQDLKKFLEGSTVPSWEILKKMSIALDVRPNFLTGMGRTFRAERVRAILYFLEMSPPPYLGNLNDHDSSPALAKEWGDLMRRHQFSYGYLTGAANIVLPASLIASEKIQEYRKVKGYSQGDLARLTNLGWYQTIVSQLERGQVDISFEQLYRVAFVLKESPFALLKNSKASLKDLASFARPALEPDIKMHRDFFQDASIESSL